MNPTIRNLLAVVAGIAVGIIVNIIVISISMMITGIPEGVDLSTQEALDEFSRSADTSWFLGPLIAHLLGTLVGAFVCARIATGMWLYLAIGVAVFFLIGGVIQRIEAYQPLVITILDIGGYLPMGWFGWKLAGARR